MATALDTSVIVSGLLAWHELHEAAATSLVELLESSEEIVLPLQALIESYAVMTRLPPPNRLNSQDAQTVLRSSFRKRTRIVGLEGEEGWRLIEELDQRRVAGGTSYDALILACARKGGASRILTFNRAHFERLAGAEEIEIVVPSL